MIFTRKTKAVFIRVFSFLAIFIGVYLYFAGIEKAEKVVLGLINDPLIWYKKFSIKSNLKKELSTLGSKLQGEVPKWYENQIQEDFSYITKLPLTIDNYVTLENFILQNSNLHIYMNKSGRE